MKVSNPITWNININGNTHEVVYIPNITINRVVFTVDGERIPIKIKSFKPSLGMEQPFYIDGIECLLVSYNGIDLVVDGISQKTQQPYISVKKFPWWFWIFFVLCVAVPFVAGGGAFPFLLGVGGSALCVGIVRKSDFNAGKKVLLCFLTTAVAWGLFALIVYLSANMA